MHVLHLAVQILTDCGGPKNVILFCKNHQHNLKYSTYNTRCQFYFGQRDLCVNITHNLVELYKFTTYNSENVLGIGLKSYLKVINFPPFIRLLRDLKLTWISVELKIIISVEIFHLPFFVVGLVLKSYYQCLTPHHYPTTTLSSTPLLKKQY